MALSVSFPISLGVILLNDVNSFPLGDFKSIIPIMSAIHNMYHEWDRSGMPNLACWRVGLHDLNRQLYTTKCKSSKFEQHRWG